MSKRFPDVDREDLESEYDFVNEKSGSSAKRPSIRDDELWRKEKPGEIKPPSRSKAAALFDEEQSRIERHKRRLMTLDVYSRHKELINQYCLYYPGSTALLQRDTSRDRTDYDVLKEHHQFLWDEQDLSKAAQTSWEARLAKRYYDKLFKEYCIADLSQYQKNRIAMRWRIEKEVKTGKGQFECGNKRCNERNGLSSWEVNFAYIEKNVKKNALVKLRLCPECSKKLNYHSKRRKVEKKKKHAKRSRTTDEMPESDEADTTNTVSANTESTSEFDTKLSADAIKKEADDLKEKAREMMEIWRKPQEDVDPVKAAQQELDDFLDDMFL